MATNFISKVALPLLLLVNVGCAPMASTSSSSANTGTSALTVAQFSPASGTLTAVPSSVSIQFSEGFVDAVQGALVSNYQMVCNGAAVNASAATISAGWANISFAAQSVATGSTCYFVVSNNIADTSGNFLSGIARATYTISNSGGFSWSEASSTTYMGIAGGSGGSSFSEGSSVGSGSALSGFNINVGTYIQGMQGVWTNAGAGSGTGVFRGVSPLTSAITCPSGYRVTGIYGYYNTYINAVGLYCADAAQSSTAQVPLAGAINGTSFSISCPSGQFATNFYGASGSLVDAVGIGCR